MTYSSIEELRNAYGLWFLSKEELLPIRLLE